MKVTKLGLITAAKNFGLFLASYTFSGIAAEPGQFCLAAIIFACVSIPSDLYLLNHASKEK